MDRNYELMTYNGVGRAAYCFARAYLLDGAAGSRPLKSAQSKKIAVTFEPIK